MDLVSANSDLFDRHPSPLIEVSDNVWEYLDSLRNVAEALDANGSFDKVVLFGGFAAALRSGMVGWKSGNAGTDLDFLIEAPPEDQTALDAHVQRLYGGNPPELGVDAQFFVTDLRGIGEELENERTALLGWMFRTATPLHAKSDIAPSDRERVPQARPDAVIRVGSAGPLLFGKLLAWALERDHARTHDYGTLDMAALVQAGAVGDVERLLRIEKRVNRSGFGQLVESLQTVATLASRRIGGCREFLEERTRGIDHAWRKGGPWGNHPVTYDRPSSDQVVKTFDVIAELPARLTAFASRLNASAVAGIDG
jgi:hypothetical protein